MKVRELVFMAILIAVVGAPAEAIAGAPTSCAQADNQVGCCSGEVLYYCGNAGGPVKTVTCSAGTVCGWNATDGDYDCVAPPGGVDPSRMYPIACGVGVAPATPALPRWAVPGLAGALVVAAAIGARLRRDLSHQERPGDR